MRSVVEKQLLCQKVSLSRRWAKQRINTDGLDDSWCHSADANYVKSLSSLAYTFDRRSFKLLIVKGLPPVAEGRRKVTLVTCVTKVIARTS